MPRRGHKFPHSCHFELKGFQNERVRQRRLVLFRKALVTQALRKETLRGCEVFIYRKELETRLLVLIDRPQPNRLERAN